MRSHRFLLGAAIALILIASAPEAVSAATMSAHTTYQSEGITFHWTFIENQGNPVGHPEWTGYDVYRRTAADCGPRVRVNAVPFPRTVGATHSHAYQETPPAAGTLYEYSVVFVDALRQPVSLSVFECDFCVRSAWASFPENSAPLVQGTIEDLGWAVYVLPCAGSCYGSFYVEGSPMAEELRTFAGTGTPLSLFGSAYCGTVEGCGMTVASYRQAPCAVVTPASRPSWGRIKSIYR